MKTGLPPTARKALTGEFTPPGMYFKAFSNKDMLEEMSIRLTVFNHGERAPGKFYERHKLIVVTELIIVPLVEVSGKGAL
jgi:hypothetical protein